MTFVEHKRFKAMLRTRVSGHVAISSAKVGDLIHTDNKDPFWGNWNAQVETEEESSAQVYDLVSGQRLSLNRPI